MLTSFVCWDVAFCCVAVCCCLCRGRKHSLVAARRGIGGQVGHWQGGANTSVSVFGGCVPRRAGGGPGHGGASRGTARKPLESENPKAATTPRGTGTRPIAPLSRQILSPFVHIFWNCGENLNSRSHLHQKLCTTLIFTHNAMV